MNCEWQGGSRLRCARQHGTPTEDAVTADRLRTLAVQVLNQLSARLTAGVVKQNDSQLMDVAEPHRDGEPQTLETESPNATIAEAVVGSSNPSDRYFEYARLSYTEVLDATKHQDDKIGRLLTAVAFLTVAALAMVQFKLGTNPTTAHFCLPP